MARTLSIADLFVKRYNYFQALAAEIWAASVGIEPSYPDGILPTVDQVDDLEAAETLYIQETPAVIE